MAGGTCAIAWHRNYLDGERTRATQGGRAASRAVGFPKDGRLSPVRSQQEKDA
ncbi:hypothetical protein GCM10023178_44350 [Actinomadura luteofluorescens]